MSWIWFLSICSYLCLYTYFYLLTYNYTYILKSLLMYRSKSKAIPVTGRGSLLLQFSHYWIKFIITNFRSRRNTTDDRRSWNNPSHQPRYKYHRRITYKQWSPPLPADAHCQLVWFEHSSSPVPRMYSFLLVKTDDSRCHPMKCISHPEATSPRIYSDHLEIPLDFTYGGRNCPLLRVVRVVRC
jgi:hypothetical protein